MPRPKDPLDAILDESSGSPFAAIWRGYVQHSLLFYKQNNLSDFAELARLGGGRAPKASDLDGLKGHARETLRGLMARERYWGSLRLSPESISHFQKAQALSPGSVWPVFLEGMAQEMRRRYTAAISLQERAIALRPGWAYPWILKGICRWYQADFKGSVEDFRRAAKLAPKSELPLLFSARAKADLRDRSLVKDLDRALELAPESGFVLSWRGRANFILKKTPAALKDLARSIELLPDYDRGWSWLGVSYAEQGKWAKARTLLKKARELNPYYPTTQYPLARASMRLGDWAAGEKFLKEAAAVDRQGVWVEHRISMSHPNPACLRSIADLDALLERKPRAAWALAWRGQTKLLLQDYREALADLNKALALEPRDAWARTWRGEVLRRMGCFDAALKDLKKARGVGWALAAAGHCELMLDRPSEALRSFDASLTLQGDCAQVRAWRAEASLRLGREKAAISNWQDALVLQPSAHWIHGRLWSVWTRLGERARALSELKKASVLYPEGPPDGARPVDPEAMRVYCRREESKACLRALDAGDFEAAYDAARKETRDIRSCVFRGWLLLNAGRAAGAVEEASRALDFSLDPTCGEALWLRDEALKHAGL